jgi:hypothetical protein
MLYKEIITVCSESYIKAEMLWLERYASLIKRGDMQQSLWVKVLETDTETFRLWCGAHYGMKA